jgi:hypothetical protein
MATQSNKFTMPIWLGAGVFGAIALFFLWEEHRAHILGALPYAFLLMCPLMHLLMHRGHGHHGDDRNGHEGHSHPGSAS